MKYIKTTKKYKYKYINEITEYMDKYLKYHTDMYKTYIYDDKYNNKWTLRLPGRSIGYIEVDDNEIIMNISIYEDCMKYYNQTILDNLDKFNGMKLFIEK